MWLWDKCSRLIRRQVDSDSEERLAKAKHAVIEAHKIADASDPVASRSRELSEANSIARVIADSLRVQPPRQAREH